MHSGAISYLNPKRAAALDIAKNIMAHGDEVDDNRNSMERLRQKDQGLYNLVLEELAKYGYRIPGLS